MLRSFQLTKRERVSVPMIKALLIDPLQELVTGAPMPVANLADLVERIRIVCTVYDPRTGRELWMVRHLAWSAAPRPVYHNGLVFVVTGHGPTELWAIRTGGTGDVTDTHVAWKFGKPVAKTASPVIVPRTVSLAMNGSAHKDAHSRILPR